MGRISKRMQKINEIVAQRVKPGEFLPVAEACALLKELSTVKFAESVEIAVNLGVDTKKSDQLVRGAVLLPHGTGKTVRVAVITQGMPAEAAKVAGADRVGFDDLVAEIKAGQVNFDVLIATPDTMAVVGQLGPILGPRGLMPNPKVGTVTSDTASAVKNIKKGQVQYKTDKSGIVHCRIGCVTFTVEQLVENLKTFIAELTRVKPSTSKGVYLKKVVVSTTMGPGLIVDPKSLS